MATETSTPSRTATPGKIPVGKFNDAEAAAVERGHS